MVNDSQIIEQGMRFYYDTQLRTSSPDDSLVNEAVSILYALSKLSLDDILSYMRNCEENWSFVSADIPQFSSFADCFAVVDKLIRSGLDGVSFSQMGFFLRNTQRKKGADCKYGENHSKCASMMGLCITDKGVWINSFGVAYEKLDEGLKASLQPKLCLGIKLIRGYFLDGESQTFLEEAMNTLSDSTRKRRLPNIRTLIETVKREIT